MPEPQVISEWGLKFHRMSTLYGSPLTSKDMNPFTG